MYLKLKAYATRETDKLKTQSKSTDDTLRSRADGFEVLVPLEDRELGVAHLDGVELR